MTRGTGRQAAGGRDTTCTCTLHCGYRLGGVGGEGGEGGKMPSHRVVRATFIKEGTVHTDLCAV